MIPVPDWLLVTVQWVHHMGAIAWVGGSIFFRFVLQPAFRKAGIGRDSARTIGHEFGSIVRIAIVILIVTGAFMAVVHLGAGGNSRLYIGLLALKITLAFYMFLVVWLRRRSAPSNSASGQERFWSRFRRAVTGTTALLILGVAVIGLADVLGAVHGSGGHGHGSDGHGSDGHSEVVESNGHVEDSHSSDDHHHKSEDSVDGDMGGLKSPEPGKEPQGGEIDHHGDDGHAEEGDGEEDEDTHDHDHAEEGDGEDDEDTHDDGHAEEGDGEEDEDTHDHDHAEEGDGEDDENTHDDGHAEEGDGEEDENGHDDGHDHAH